MPIGVNYKLACLSAICFAFCYFSAMAIKFRLMKQILFLFLLLTTALYTNAQTKDERAVAKAVESLRVAMIDANGPALQSAAAAKLSYGHSSGRVETKEEFVANILSGKSDFVSIELSEQTVAISNKVALVRHVFTAATNDGGKPGTIKLKVLLVFEKQKGHWLLLARQAVKLA
jgi:ketosteroid isomerase-like protein